MKIRIFLNKIKVWYKIGFYKLVIFEDKVMNIENRSKMVYLI